MPMAASMVRSLTSCGSQKSAAEGAAVAGAKQTPVTGNPSQATARDGEHRE